MSWFCGFVVLVGCVFVVFVCLLALVCVLPLCLLVLWVSCWLSTCSAAAVARFVGAVCLLVLWVRCFCELCACCFVGSLFLLFLLGCEVESKKGKELSRWKHEKTLGAAGHAATAECGHG